MSCSARPLFIGFKAVAVFSALFGSLVVQTLPTRADEGELKASANLVVDGVPPIPDTLVRAVDAYTESRAALIGSWHPQRREMVMLTRFAETYQVHSLALPLGARTQLTFKPERIAAASFPPKGPADYFVFSMDVGGGEWFQNFRFDLASKKTTLLTDGKSRNTLGVWSNDGARLAYTSTRRTGKDLDIYVIDPRNPNSDRLMAQLEGPGWTPRDWSDDDRQLAVIELISVNESHVWVFDMSTGEKRRVSLPHGDEPVSYDDVQFLPGGKKLLVASDRNSEFQQLQVLDVKSGQEEPLLASGRAKPQTRGPSSAAPGTSATSPSSGPYDVDAFELSSDGRTVAVATNEQGASRVWFLDVKSKRTSPGPKLPTGVLWNMKWHPNGRELGLSWSASNLPGDIYSYVPKTGRLVRWTDSETGEINVSDFRQPDIVEWKSFDGRTITGFLHRPPARFTGKRPVIINIHGGPEGQARPWFLGRNNYYVEELGVAMLFPNIRGSTGFGKTFVKLDNGKKREDAYRDIGALFDFIAMQPDLDPTRVMVTGGSYGGHMTLAVATRYPDRIRCAVSVVGMSSLVTFLERTESYRRDLRRVEYGDERDPEMRAYLESIAPLRHVDKIAKPLFIVQGQNDPRVPASEAEQIVASLKGKKVPVWYLLAKDEGHGFVKKANADFQFYATVLFVQKFLLP